MPRPCGSGSSGRRSTSGQRDRLTTCERERIRALECENKKLRRANKILKTASAFFPRRNSTADSSLERLCGQTSRYPRSRADLQSLANRPVGLSPQAAQQRNPDLRGARAKTDDTLMPEIQRVWQANMRVYGADKVWKQMNREGMEVARCTVERLMTFLGL